MNVTLSQNNIAEHFIIEALANAIPLGDREMWNKYVPQPFSGTVDVQFSINGLEIDFVKLVNDIWKLESDNISNKVNEAVKEKLSSSRLYELANSLNRVEHIIEAELAHLEDKEKNEMQLSSKLINLVCESCSDDERVERF